MTRTIALAVDGMEPSLLSQWSDVGKLPNLKALGEEGAYGVAECSSLSSAKQWTTHFTGVRPDRHHITGFTKGDDQRQAGDDAPEVSKLVNLSDIAVKTYPELLSEDQVSVGLINPLPLWPPLELENGFCISGLLTPSSTDQWVEPPGLETELQEFNYQIDIQYGNRPYGFIDDDLFDEVSITQLYSDIFEVLETRIEYTKHAIINHPTDYLYVLLKSIDVIQHCFWAHLVEDHDEYKDTIQKSYQLVDELVGWIWESVDANILVFSDHGFQARQTDPPATIHRFARALKRRVWIPDLVRKTYLSSITNPIETDDESGKITATTGVHADPAAWVLAGPDVQPEKNVEIQFEDLTPTVLALVGRPIPVDYIGTPIKCLSVDPVTEERSLSIRRRLDINQSEVISERLHNLGYAEMVDDND